MNHEVNTGNGQGKSVEGVITGGDFNLAHNSVTASPPQTSTHGSCASEKGEPDLQRR